MADETPPTSASDSGSSQSDSDVPPETEECPSITAEAALDSDEDGDFLPVDKAGGVSGTHHPGLAMTHPLSLNQTLAHPLLALMCAWLTLRGSVQNLEG